jgi:hypothetical protein
MGRKNKAYTVDFMPEYTSRDEMIAHFQRCYHDCSRQKANQLLHSEQQLWDRDRARCRLWYNKERESWKGRKTQAATALFGLPTQGGKDNLRNFLTASIKDQYLTTAELEALIESKYGEDKAATKYKRAIDPRRQILQYHRSARRWSVWGKSEPDPADFGPEAVDGKYGDRVRLYGLMPRDLKHKPGEKYVPEESQVLQWMGKQSGETDLAKIDAEYNRLPRAWINSKTDEKDSDYSLSKAIRIYDRGTGETLGILTYRAEEKAKEEQPKEGREKLSKLEERQMKGLSPAGTEDEIERSKDGYVAYDVNFVWWIGEPGSEKKLDGDMEDEIFRMPRKNSKESSDFLGKLFKRRSVSIERLLNGLWELDALAKYTDGDFEGRESADNHKAEAEEREQREADRQKAEEEARQKKRTDQLRVESEKLKDLPPDTGMSELHEFIVNRCNLSTFEWPEIFQYARDNGFIIFDAGISCGSNNQPIALTDTSS